MVTGPRLASCWTGGQPTQRNTNEATCRTTTDSWRAHVHTDKQSATYSTADAPRATDAQYLALGRGNLQNTLDPSAILELAALHAVLGTLRDIDDPVALFARHAHAQPEFQLVLSVLPDIHHPGLPHDILDTAFLLRWTELVATGNAPQELKPLPPCRARSED